MRSVCESAIEEAWVYSSVARQIRGLVEVCMRVCVGLEARSGAAYGGDDVPLTLSCWL